MLTSKLLFIQRSIVKQHQNMVREIIRPLSNSSKSEKHETSELIDTYEKAISTLNSFQSNASTIAESVELRKHNVASTRVKETEKFMRRSGIDYNDLDKLSVIHVAGSKGKGSTCAFTESILRSCGVKTGFFSSPHLIHVNERIQINGQPISKDLFAKYFWKVFRSLDRKKEHVHDMPPYFKFLTLMSFHIFFAEKVDVVILEVGIGGEHDCTNVVRNTKTVGITSLGLEHTAILGDTLTDIAWQKSGIIKENSDVFTVNQPEECIATIRKRCYDRNAKLHIIPSFSEYVWPSDSLGFVFVFNKVQQLNASMGIQLSWHWLTQNNNKLFRNHKLIEVLRKNSSYPFLTIASEFITGLKAFSWPGRFQTLHRKNQRLFIDGAHTIESLEMCLDWFKANVQGSSNRKFLLFNVTGDRDAEKMLNVLAKDAIFECALFSPNLVRSVIDIENDSFNILQVNNNCENCTSNANVWHNLEDQRLSRYNECESGLKSTNWNSSAKVFSCVTEVFSFLDHEYAANNREIDVLVTGSLHLVGATLSAINEEKC